MKNQRRFVLRNRRSPWNDRPHCLGRVPHAVESFSALKLNLGDVHSFSLSKNEMPQGLFVFPWLKVVREDWRTES